MAKKDRMKTTNTLKMALRCAKGGSSVDGRAFDQHEQETSGGSRFLISHSRISESRGKVKAVILARGGGLLRPFYVREIKSKMGVRTSRVGLCKGHVPYTCAYGFPRKRGMMVEDAGMTKKANWATLPRTRNAAKVGYGMVEG